MKHPRMDTRHLLAAETFAYSYANYADHMDNPRFADRMPEDIDILAQADREQWDDHMLGARLEVDEATAADLRERYRRACEVVNAPNAEESFRRGVHCTIQDALEAGLTKRDDIDDLVTQICYRAADFAYLLDLEGKSISAYEEMLRDMPSNSGR